jgi:hypothetical protein
VEFIRSPKSSFEQLAQKIARRKNVTIEAAQIERYFAQHGLKKTTRIGVPTP